MLAFAVCAQLGSSAPTFAQPAAGPAGAPSPHALAGLDAYVQRTMRSWEAPGLAVVVVRGDSVFARGYGVKEAGGTDSVDAETLFPIGSLTKAFTATVLATLVDERAISWDDPIVRHLPGFALRDEYATRRLTIRDVLSHRTGLAGGDLIWAGGAVDAREVVRRLRFQESAFDVRAGYRYTNEAYLLAGVLAATVAGRPWSELVRDRIFKPLGMARSTTSLGQLREHTNVALPHDEIGPGQLLGTVPVARGTTGAPTRVSRVDWFEVPTVAAGGIASSASEFAQWLRLQLGAGEVGGKRIVGERALMETRSPQFPIPGFPQDQSQVSETNLNAAGMGWSVRDYRGRLMVTHLGSTPGWGSAVALLPGERAGVAVFVNISQGMWPANSVMRFVLDRLLGADFKDWNEQPLEWAQQRRQLQVASLTKAAAARTAGTKPSLPLASYAGTYVDSLYPPARVTLRNGTLRLSLGPMLAGDLDHWQDEAFRVTWDRADFGANLVTFHVGGDSRPDSIQTRVLGQSALWRRMDEPPGSIEGAWRLIRSETHLPDGTVRAGSPQESFLLFSGSFYSMNTAGGREPSPFFKSRFQPTDEEKLDRYNRLLINAGRYRAADGRLTIHPTFALVPEFAGGLGEFDYELDGDTLRLIWRDIRSADGVRDPRTAEGWTYHYTWVRMR
jgi:CubicO group peptidase (beta-lactamase class C family)